MTSPHNLNPIERIASPQAGEVVNPALIDALSVAWSSQPEVQPRREMLTPTEIIAAISEITERMRGAESTDGTGTIIDEAAHAKILEEIYRSDDFNQAG